MFIQFASLCCKRRPSSYSWFIRLHYHPLFTTAIHQAKGCICHDAKEQTCSEMLPLKGTVCQHKMKSNTEHVLCRCPLGKPVDSWGLSFQLAQFPSLTCPPWLQCWYPGGRLSGRGQGMWKSLNHSLWLLLVQASTWKKGPVLKPSIYFSTKQWWDIPASYLTTYIFSCCKRSTGGDQGSCWSHTVNGGMELISCPPQNGEGWQKQHLNSRVGDAPL